METLFIWITNGIKSLLSFLKILVRSKLFLAQASSTVQDKHCFVLGNGPSLKKVLADSVPLLSNHTLLAVNNFSTTAFYEKLTPRYYLITSKEFWRPGKIKKHQDNRDNIIHAIIEKTNWPLTLFCPYDASRVPSFIQNIKRNPNINIQYFNTTPVEGLPLINRFFMKRGWGMPRPHNVLIPSIFNCINIGFKEIYVIGADHSWLPLISVTEENVALVNHQHFYNEGKTKGEIMHRDSLPRRLHEILEKFMLSFQAYFTLNDYAQTRQTKIYNCTPGSFIDAFERKSLVDVLNEKSEKGDNSITKSS